MAWKDEDATKPSVSRLAKLIGTHAPYDGIFELRVPGVSVIRLSRTNDESIHGLAKSAVCIVAQGAKTVMVGEDVYEYEAGQVAVYSVDIPVVAQITRASHAQPYLNLKIDLDAQRLPS